MGRSARPSPGESAVCRVRGCAGPIEGQPDREPGAVPDLRLEGQRAAVMLDDGPGNGESKSGAPAHGFRREERIEDAGLKLRRDARSGVLDGDDRVSPIRARADGYLATPIGARNDIGDGVARVDDEIEKHLIELPGM